MVTRLPKIGYKGKSYFVDFRLGELRDIKTAKPLKFSEIKEDKYSPFKAKLRGLRFKTWGQEYIRGVDD